MSYFKTPRNYFTLENILIQHDGDLTKLSMEELSALEDEADLAIFKAGLALDYIRKVIERKVQDENARINDDNFDE